MKKKTLPISKADKNSNQIEHLSLNECRVLLNKRSFNKVFPHLQYLASQKSGEAAYLLSQLYDRGDGTEANLEQSALWLKTAADLEYPEAEYKYAMTIAPFLGQEEFSYQLCANCLSKAVSHQHPYAMLELAKLYFTGRGVENDKKKAIELIIRASQINPQINSDEEIGSCYYANVELATALPYLKKAYNAGRYGICGILSSYYMRGIAGVKQNVELAFGILKKGAENKNGLSEYIIGCHYRDEMNFKKAQLYFKQAYDHKILEAAYALANILIKSPNCNRADARNAFRLLKEASTYPTTNQNEALADLGSCYHEGWGCDCNYEKAVECFKQVLKSEPGNKVAMLGLGFCYLKGHGVKTDIQSGLNLIKRAAEAGVRRASALLYTSKDAVNAGERYVKTTDEYLYYLKLAADNEDDEACYKLGNLYLKGELVSQSNEQAEHYLGKAADLLNENALKLVLEITDKQGDGDPEFLCTCAIALQLIYGNKEFQRLIGGTPEAIQECKDSVIELFKNRLFLELPIPSAKSIVLLNEITIDNNYDLLCDVAMPQFLE